MHHILLASLSEEENVLLRKKLESLDAVFPDLRYQTCLPTALPSVVDAKYSVVILSLQHFKSSQKDLIKQIRTSGYFGPILITARPHSAESVRELERMENVVFLEKPFETRDLLGIVSKFIKSNHVRQRIFRRYNTSTKAVVQPYTKEDRHEGTVCNLSKGGAFLVGKFDEEFKIGELLRLHISLNEVERQYTVPVRIVWKTNTDAAAGLGVAFVKSDEVYQYLLSSL